MPDESGLIEAPNTADLRKEGLAAVGKAESLSITTVEEQEVAQRSWKGIGILEKKVKDRLNPIIDHMNKAKKGLTTLRAELLGPFANAKRMIERKVGEYERIAWKKAEEEARRRLAEEKKKAEEAQELAALQAEEEGEKELADEIISEPVNVPSVPIEPDVAKTEGVSSRKTWHGEVTDMKKLVQYIAKNPEWIHLVEPATTAINGLARSMKGVLNIPGIKAVKTSSLVGR